MARGRAAVPGLPVSGLPRRPPAGEDPPPWPGLGFHHISLELGLGLFILFFFPSSQSLSRCC